MGYRVEILPGGRSLDVAPGETVLGAALKQGFGFPYSCRNGSCGACMGRLLDGRIHYPSGRPAVLTERDEKRGYAIFCQANPLSDLRIEAEEITQTRAQQVRTLPARVESIDDLAPDVKRLLLRLPPDERLEFLAGQYIDILLRDGRRRSFSLANASREDRRLELHIRHCPGGRFTGYVFNALRERALLRFEGPLGTFFQRDTGRPTIMVAGGTGLAPLKGMIEDALDRGTLVHTHLFWGARALVDLYLQETVLGWCTANSTTFDYTPVLSEAGDDGWQGERGWVHEAVLRRYPDLSAFDVYMSGPPAMITAAREPFAAAGLDSAKLFFDAFDYADDSGT